MATSAKTKGEVKRGLYFDSVTLMTVGRDIRCAKGVLDAAVVMGTRENRALLTSSGLWTPEFEGAKDTDLLLAVKADSAQSAAQALREAGAKLGAKRGAAEDSDRCSPRSLEGACRQLPGANLALISIAGRYAAQEAMKALRANLHVLLFSDNVPIDKELELKRFAHQKGLLLMGPDCGTAIINGVPLAFANVVARGDIGIVAAAGTGLQEVSTLISNQGAGISQAIGTGGRDVKKEIGGIMFLDGISALLADPATRVIVLVSKPPHESVLAKIGRAVKGARKPVIAVFLGADRKLVENSGMIPAEFLDEAAALAVAMSKGRDLGAARRDFLCELQAPAGHPPLRGRIRGLFSGGTFCTEAQLVFHRAGLHGVRSNVPLPPSKALPDVWKSQGHTVIDLGDDAFTVGRPHPMIDYSLRNRRILEEAKDPETALILLDVVLGYGANMDPAAELAPVLRKARSRRGLVVACSVTGTKDDPQDRAKVAAALEAAGAKVFPSNAAAARYCARRVRD